MTAEEDLRKRNVELEAENGRLKKELEEERQKRDELEHTINKRLGEYDEIVELVGTLRAREAELANREKELEEALRGGKAGDAAPQTGSDTSRRGAASGDAAPEEPRKGRRKGG